MTTTTDNQRQINPNADVPRQSESVQPDVYVTQTAIPSRASNSSPGFIAVVVVVLAGLAFAMYVFSRSGTTMPDVIQNNTSQAAPEAAPPAAVPEATTQQPQPDTTIQQTPSGGQTETVPSAPAPSTNP